jgi:hypothetical protein
MESDDATLTVPVMAVKYSAKLQCKLYDLGASHHMSLHLNNQVLHAIGKEDLQIKLPNGKKLMQVLLKDALHAPDLALTVVSVGCIMKVGYNTEFDKIVQKCHIYRKKTGPIISQIPVGPNYLFKVKHTLSATDESLAQSMDILTLHQRLGHISVNAIHALICAGSITGLQLIDDFPPFTCDSCKYAKTTRKPIRKE